MSKPYWLLRQVGGWSNGMYATSSIDPLIAYGLWLFCPPRHTPGEMRAVGFPVKK